MAKPRGGRDIWILAVLLAAFVGATVIFTQRSAEEEGRERPSTHNTRRGGARAIYDLVARQGLRTSRFERPLTELPRDAGLLVIVEPLQRPLQVAEISALQRWLDEGGTLLFVAQGSLGEEDPSNLGFEEARAVPNVATGGSAEIHAKRTFGRDVKDLNLTGETSLEILKPEKVRKLVTSGPRVLAAMWREKKGRVVMVSRSIALENGSLSIDPRDNPVFFVNVAQQAASAERPLVLFDEYHQGYGERTYVDKSLWQAMGPGLRATAWYSLFGFLLGIYALNRRFGPVKSLPMSGNRPSTEYIASMAALYQRSGAGALAMETISRDFLRDLATQLDMSPSDPPEQLALEAQKRLGWDGADLSALLRLSAELIAATGPADRATEQNITAAAQRLHAYRMDLSNRKN